MDLGCILYRAVILTDLFGEMGVLSDLTYIYLIGCVDKISRRHTT